MFHSLYDLNFNKLTEVNYKTIRYKMQEQKCKVNKYIQLILLYKVLSRLFYFLTSGSSNRKQAITRYVKNNLNELKI